ncbi:MAG: type IV pilus modification protein PilV [Gammaproteobacteria bacterium]|nr:type IV pilus modification protein PilV [Gammaproteobacteria bacterium]
MLIKNTSTTSGFTLLEVMIAMMIFSIGMLGLAGIQATAVQNNNTAYQRTIAMQQSYNMSDLIRSSANFDGFIDPSFDEITTAVGTAPSPNCFLDVNDDITKCTTSEMAAFNIYHWKKRLAGKQGLPSGRGKVTRDGDTYEIIIMWDEKRNGATNEDCGTTALKCYKLQIQV